MMLCASVLLGSKDFKDLSISTWTLEANELDFVFHD